MLSKQTLCWADSSALCHACLRLAAVRSGTCRRRWQHDGKSLSKTSVDVKSKTSVDVKSCICVGKLILRGLPPTRWSSGALTLLGTQQVMLSYAELGERLISICQEH